jgi:predicted glutamine amidotransferase
MIPDDLFGRLTGVSDTEALFLVAVAAVRAGATAGEALAEVVSRITRAAEAEDCEAQLTMLLSDGQVLAACRASNRPISNTLYRAEAPSVAAGGTVLASEPLSAADAWGEVPHGQVLEVSRGAARRWSL